MVVGKPVVYSAGTLYMYPDTFATRHTVPPLPSPPVGKTLDNPGVEMDTSNYV